MKKEEKKKDLRNNARANNRFISDYLLCKVSLEQRYSSIFPCSNISPNDTSKIYLELEIQSVITFEEEKLSRVSCIQNESTIISVFQNISVGKEERKPSCRKG